MKLIYTLSICLMMLNVKAQTNESNQPEVSDFLTKPKYVHCVSTEYELELQNKFHDRSREAAFETWLQSKINDNKSAKVQNTVYRIPVVIHVIHNGDAIGVGENISTAKAISQITILNQDFRRMLGTNGFNSNAVGADMEIEFCLAQQTPTGGPSNGINRVNKGVAQWETRDEVQNMKTETQWDPTRYFNIWVCFFTDDSAFPSNQGGMYNLLGYAQFPETNLPGITSNNSANTDGIVIDYRCFGSSQIAAGNYYSEYNLGRTVTHEIGHSLGLRHIWGDNVSCTTNTADSFKDYCPDTPAANKANYDCLQTYNSCPASAGNDMVENYMDYTNDSCMNIFTANQKTRMRTIMENSPRRLSLRTSTVCQVLSNKQFGMLEDLKIYPNPAKDNVSISLSGLANSYEIYNNIGQLVLRKIVVSETDMNFNISGFSNGIYLIKVFKETESKTLKFIKN